MPVTITVIPILIAILGWSVALLIAYILLQATIATRKTGMAYNASPRDERIDPGVHALRAKRATLNFLETYPAFIALVLALVVAGRGNESAVTAAWVWLGARIVYLPLYIIGIPFLRTIAWAVSLGALLSLLNTLMGWM